ncbi:MAG: hypothetical protein R3B60_03325 [Candidatus Paceibacterota bacterium]
MTTEKKKSVTKGQVIGIVLFILFLFWLFAGNETNPDIAIETGITDSQTYIISQNFVKEILKAPATADFPFGEYTHIKNDEDTHTVTSYVDSENGFGANVRNNWTVTLTHNGGDWATQSNWTLDRLIFDGEAIYLSDDFENAISTLDEELAE